jgi:hypothetical protein
MQFAIKLQILQLIVQVIVGAGLLIQGHLLLKRK